MCEAFSEDEMLEYDGIAKFHYCHEIEGCKCWIVNVFLLLILLFGLMVWFVALLFPARF